MTAHKKDLIAPTRGVCGAGYSWPSTITLKVNWSDVDCPACQAKRQEMVDRLTTRLAPHGGCNTPSCIDCFPETAI